MSDLAPVRPRSADTATGVDHARRLAPGTLLAGRYRIVSMLGMGGMGIVYRAHDEELGVEVAVKVLRPELAEDPQWHERFRRELVLGRQVTHRNVVRIHDIGESDGLRFITMDFVEGRSLQAVLDQSPGGLPPERALRIACQLADALQHAHDAGVVHRDLKPGNVLLAPDDTAYITDFGVARSLRQAGVTQAGAIVGTPDYLSPEQASGGTVDARSDLYALGILLYEMLTGQLPFSGDSQAEMLAQRIMGRTRDITETGIAVPGYVRAALRLCLERSPARRYQSARDLLRDLERRKVGTRRVPRRAALALGSLAVLAVPAVWLLGRARSLEPAAPAAAAAAAAATTRPALHSLAVLPLADETGDVSMAWAGTGVAEMLAARLAESADLRVVDAQRLVRTLEDLQVRGGRYDDRVLRQLAEVLDLDRIVTGAVRRAGPTVRVDVRLHAVTSSGTLDARALDASSGEPDGLFRVVGDLGERLREALGAARPSDPPEPDAAETRSPEAARAYREGRDHLLRADPVRALEALDRAVAADPAFAAALERLSEAHQALGHHDRAVAAAEKAAAAVGSAESRLGWRVRARLAMLRGDPASAEKSYAELARRYPHDNEPLLDLAAAQSAQGASARAVETLREATARDASDPRAWFLLGKNSVLMGEARKAVDDYLVRALTLHNRLRNEPGQADALNALGVGHHQLGQYAQAVEKYSAAADIRRRVGDERGLGTSLKNRARTYQAMGRFDDVEPDLVAARAIYEKVGDPGGLADVLNDFGLLHEGRGDYGAARRSYQASLKVRRTLGNDRQLAQSYDNVGYIFFLEGEYDSALVYWQQALDLRRRIGEKGGVVLSTQNMGFLHMAQGRWDEAVKAFVQALDGAREIDFKNAVAVSFGNMGVLHQYAGRHRAALGSFAEARAVLRQLDDRRGLIEFALKEAAALLEMGADDAARARLDEAEPLLQETRNLEQSSEYHLLRGEGHLHQGDRAGARAAFARAVEQARASHGRAALLRAQVAAASVAPPAAAAGTLARLAQEADALGEALLRIRSLEALGRAELARGATRPAEAAARKAIAAADRAGWEAGRYRLHGLLGRVLEAKGDAAGAADAYQESARRAARLREELDTAQRAAFDRLPGVADVQARLVARTARGGPS
jgi:eukaryotic-like serine/threonine-protein kinase